MAANWISISEAMTYSHLSRSYLRDLWERNRITARKSGNFWLIDKDTLDTYLATRKTRGKAEQSDQGEPTDRAEVSAGAEA